MALSRGRGTRRFQDVLDSKWARSVKEEEEDRIRSHKEYLEHVRKALGIPKEEGTEGDSKLKLYYYNLSLREEQDAARQQSKGKQDRNTRGYQSRTKKRRERHRGAKKKKTAEDRDVKRRPGGEQSER